MKKIFFPVFILIAILQGCNCEDASLGPKGFLFEFVDKTTGENLFTNGTYHYYDIKITNTLNADTKYEFNYLEIDNLHFIGIYSIGARKTETVNLKFVIADKHIFNLYVEAKRIDGKCNDYTTFKNVTIEGVEYEVEPQSENYKILVD